MKLRVSILGLCLFSLVACQSNKDQSTTKTKSSKEQKISEQGNPKKEFNWSGIYQGLIPCADCEGIMMKIALKEDNSYYLKGYYQGKENSDFNYEGLFDWKDNRIILISHDTKNYQFLVLKDKLEMLDQSFNPIDSELNYSLEKTD